MAVFHKSDMCQEECSRHRPPVEGQDRWLAAVSLENPAEVLATGSARPRFAEQK
jgi:hypothetical protein